MTAGVTSPGEGGSAGRAAAQWSCQLTRMGKFDGNLKGAAVQAREIISVLRFEACTQPMWVAHSSGFSSRESPRQPEGR